MKKLSISFCLFLAITTITLGQVGIGTTTPNSSAQLDITSSNKGFLPPRVALQSTDLASPVTTPASGLLVYNTATAGTYPYNVTPGYYYWNGAIWNPVVNKAISFGDMQYWDGSKWIIIPIGNEGERLTVCNGIPVWGSCQKTLISRPDSSLYEGQINAFSPTQFNQSHQLLAEAWTSGGNPFTVRSMLKFDYSSLPANAIIDSARLYLYSDRNPVNGNSTDANFGSSNSFYIQRITSTWTLPTPFTWNNPPATSTTNQILVPQTGLSFLDLLLDVTALVKDQITNGNNGFYIKLASEVTYNIRQFYSSRYAADPTKRPRIVIYYHL